MAMDPADFISSVNFKGILNNIFNLLLLIVVAALVGGMVYMYFRWKKGKNLKGTKKIRWWEEINGQLAPVRTDIATEIIIPGTNLRVFHVKDKNMWLPRFARGITLDTFYVAITKNKELVNFTLGSIDDNLARSKLTYDHTDMRWAAENLREFVKRNYKDKATTWWKEYSQVISIAIYLVFMTLSFVAIIYFLRGLVGDIGTVTRGLADAVDKLNACMPGSGVVSAADVST